MSSSNRHKLAFLTWAVAYPVVSVLLAVLDPLLAEWPILVRTLVLTAIMAPTMVYIAMPSVVGLFRSWLDQGI